MMRIDKKVVARNFSKAAEDYNSGAQAQARIATGLVERIVAHAKVQLGQIVDLGCGSGSLCELVAAKFPKSNIRGIDIASGMIEQCRKRWRNESRVQFLVGDAEDSKLIDSNVDLVCSASSSQWFIEPETTFLRWASALSEKGMLATASLVTGSCHELARAYSQAIQRAWKGIRFVHPDMMPKIARETGLAPCCCETEIIQIFYKDAMTALRSFSTIGAQFKDQPGYAPLSSSETRRVLQAYQTLANADGQVPVSYCVQYFVAEKKGALPYG